MAPKRKPHRSDRQTTRSTNRLRIIGGQLRGRKLDFPLAEGLRPTPDRVRETLFNWLADSVAGARCLDLFAGSGALSFEALSRGARAAVLIESDDSVVRHLRDALQVLRCDAGQVVQADCMSWLNAADKRAVEPFDLVFIDPPFGQQIIGNCCEMLEKSGLLHQNSQIYTEYESNLEVSLPQNWHIHRQKQAGNVIYSLCLRDQCD